jgi:hypothetical protein
MQAADEPFALVPRGRHGWSPEVRRLVAGHQTVADQRSPWLVLDPRSDVRSAVAS